MGHQIEKLAQFVAQDYPNKTVRIVAPAAPGGATDVLAALGAEPAPMSPEEFGRYVRAEIAKWAKVVKESGAKAD